MLFKYLTLIFISLYLSGCSLGFLASKQQAVTIEKDTSVTILINKQSPIIHEGKFILERDGAPKQIDFLRDGYKPETKVMTPYRYSGLYWAGLTMNAVVGVVLAGTLANALKEDLNEGSEPLMAFAGLWFGAGFGALGNYLSPRLMKYEDKIDLNIPMLKIIKKDSTMKEVYLNKTSFDITSNNVKYQLISIKNYLKGKNKFKKAENIKKNIKIDNTIFTDEINNILEKNGFVDTSGLVLRGGFRQNIFLNTTVNELNFTRVMCNSKKNVVNPTYVEDMFNCFSTINIKTKWDVLDIYKNVIYSDTLDLKSSELIEDGSINDNELLKKHISDAMEIGLHTLMNTPKFKKEVCVSNSELVNQMKEIEIKKPARFVSSLEEAVEASLTVKSKSGHGSGFLISENGHIITNYHVVADSSKLEVVLNDGSKYKATVLQVSKDADLAILKIEKKGLIPFNISETDILDIGKEVFAIGTPKAEDLSQTLSKGIISSVRKQSNGSKIIQTDTKVNSGNSGGPLVDKEGKLLGVVNAKLTGIGTEGISFAIPSSVILPTLNIVFK